MKILFLTTHNLVTNPRLAKEIKLALQNNYEVEVICYIFRNWSYEANHDMLQEFQSEGVIFHCIEAGRENKFEWLIAVAKEKYARLLSRLIPLKNAILANAVSRRNVGLLNEVNKINSADWIIGHNPGALYATHYAGKKLNGKLGFDVEDYHPGEGNDEHLKGLTIRLMKQVLPKMNYVSFAAPLIMEEVKKDLIYSNPNWFTILNYFPSNEFKLVETHSSGPLKLVWFSQNINYGRGLELILPSVQINSDKLELHLFGNVNDGFKRKMLDGMENIILHGALPQKQLHSEICLCDVGLALEPAKDKNNNLAISNKMLSYLQASLFVLATNTKGQKSFMASFPELGICFNYNKNDFKKSLSSVLENINHIRKNRKLRKKQFGSNNWENQSNALLKRWKEL